MQGSQIMILLTAALLCRKDRAQGSQMLDLYGIKNLLQASRIESVCVEARSNIELVLYYIIELAWPHDDVRLLDWSPLCLTET